MQPGTPRFPELETDMNRHTLAKNSTGMLLFALLAATLVFSGCGSDAAPAAPKAPPADQGTTASPVVLTVGSAFNGSVGAYGISYYTFTTGTTAMTHTISLTNTGSHLRWDLYDAAGFAAYIAYMTDPINNPFPNSVDWCENQPMVAGPADVVCSTAATLAASSPYYLVVNEFETIAGNYTLNVTAP